ncbi:MAG: hypothetical protein M3512_04320 [Bacteroidota bacterium]|nr:hypothetical protein [Bacteroidota bacterium]
MLFIFQSIGKKHSLLLLSATLILSGCGRWVNTSKYSFEDGIYYSKVFQDKKTKVYVDNEEDTLVIHPVKKHERRYVADTLENKPILLPQNKSLSKIPSSSFRQNSFDIDFLTILVKVRPPGGNLPTQLNSNINGAAYAGYRADIYNISYKDTPLHFYNRKTNHFGFSLGGFFGIGATNINPYNTNNQVNDEYDGFIITKGVAGVLGLDNFNIGLVIGFDTLQGKDKNHWIYQQKPWIGIALGLNLN